MRVCFVVHKKLYDERQKKHICLLFFSTEMWYIETPIFFSFFFMKSNLRFILLKKVTDVKFFWHWCQIPTATSLDVRLVIKNNKWKQNLRSAKRTKVIFSFNLKREIVLKARIPRRYFRLSTQTYTTPGEYLLIHTVGTHTTLNTSGRACGNHRY